MMNAFDMLIKGESPQMDEGARLALATLRDHFEAIISNNDIRYKQVEETHRDALRVALESNDKRLEVLNNFREAMADQSRQMVTRVEAESGHKTLSERAEANKVALEVLIDSELRPIQARLEEIGRPNWSLLTSAVSAGFVLVTAIWLVIGLKMDAVLAPVSLQVSQLQTSQGISAERISTLTNSASASTAADSGSKADRAQLNDRIRTMEAQNNTQFTQVAVLEARMVEIETQFCAQDMTVNLMHANDLRLFSILWTKAFPNSRYPTDNVFYPKICNQNVITKSNN